MKKKIAILMAVALMISVVAVGVFSGKSKAKSAQLFLEVPDSVKKEEQFQVHVILESDVNLYSVDTYLKYDETILEFVPENDVITGSAGMLEIKDVFPEETKKKEYDITFKALETGNSELDLTEVYLIDYADMDYIEINPTAQMVEVKTNRSEDADVRLASLLVAPGQLQEEFLSDVFEYEMHVGLEVEEIGVSATPLVESSIVESEIPEKLQEGENIVTVKVTALSGNVGVYTIHIFKEDLEEDEESISEEETQAVDEKSDATEEGMDADATTEVVEEASTEVTTEDTTQAMDNTETDSSDASIEEETSQEENTEKMADLDSNVE